MTALIRRIRGRCFYCGRHIAPDGLTCQSHRTLLQTDPLYGPNAHKQTGDNGSA